MLQAPVPEGDTSAWKGRLETPDELDMLVTAKNHDLKVSRMKESTPEDWLLALLSLQTQEGFLGSGNYGISRMNGGFASRPALGAMPIGGWGRRWLRDVQALLASRADLVNTLELRDQEGIALVWLRPWSGTESLAFAALDPFYIEICRRVRLIETPDGLRCLATGSKCARIEAKNRNGVTGDAWMPVDTSAGKALTIAAKGFDYALAAELLFGHTYQRSIAQTLTAEDGQQGIVMLARGVTRGQGKTEGYHERRIPVSPKARALMIKRRTDALAAIAEGRVSDFHLQAPGQNPRGLYLLKRAIEAAKLTNQFSEFVTDHDLFLVDQPIEPLLLTKRGRLVASKESIGKTGYRLGGSPRRLLIFDAHERLVLQHHEPIESSSLHRFTRAR